MLKALVREFSRVMMMLYSPETIGWEFKDQKMSRGRSPFAIIHWTPAISPVFDGSSPNSNGVIRGGTAKSHNSKDNFVYE